MGWLSADLHGMGAWPWQPRARCRVAAIRRAVRPVPIELGDPSSQRLVGRRFRYLGLARAILPQHCPDRHRPLDPARHSRDPRFPAACRDEEDRTGTYRRGNQETAARDHPVRLVAHGRAGTVLHLYRLRVRLRRRHVEDVAESDPERGARGLVRVVHHYPAVRPYLRSDRAAEDVPDRRGSHRAVRVPLFRHAGQRDSVRGVHRDRLVADPARYPVRPPGCADRRGVHPASTLQWRIARLSARVGHRRRPGAAHRNRAVRRVPHGLCRRDLYRSLRGGEPSVGGSDAGLHWHGYLGGI